MRRQRNFARRLGFYTWELRVNGGPRFGTRSRTFHAVDRRAANAGLRAFGWLVAVEAGGIAEEIERAAAVLDELEAPGLAAAGEADAVLTQLQRSARLAEQRHRRQATVEAATRHMRARLHSAITALRDERAGDPDGP